MQNRSSSSQIYGLDLLRFFAASLVVIYHLAFLAWAEPDMHGRPEAELYRAYQPLGPWIGTGWIGVQIFFVISGFIIAYTANGRSPLEFVNSRLLRLWPGVLVCATLSLAALLLSGRPSGPLLHEYALSLILWPTGPWIASAYWTLPIEIVFYALVLLLLWRDRFVNIEVAAAAIGLACTALWCAYALHAWLPDGHVRDAVAYLAEKRLPKLALVQHACFFALGIVAWLVSSLGLTLRRALLIAVLTLGCLLQIVAETDRANAWNGYPSHAAVPLAIWIGSMLFMAGAIRWNATVARFVGPHGPTLRAIGLATYPLYLLHQPLGGSALPALLGAATSPWPALAIAVAVAIAAAFLVALILEPGAREVVRRHLLAAEERLPSRWANLRARRRPLGPTPPAKARAALAEESPP
jgi:peptidoglycan/LPS O-acetylase OafA/YrhL